MGDTVAELLIKGKILGHPDVCIERHRVPPCYTRCVFGNLHQGLADALAGCRRIDGDILNEITIITYLTDEVSDDGPVTVRDRDIVMLQMMLKVCNHRRGFSANARYETDIRTLGNAPHGGDVVQPSRP